MRFHHVTGDPIAGTDIRCNTRRRPSAVPLHGMRTFALGPVKWPCSLFLHAIQLAIQRLYARSRESGRLYFCFRRWRPSSASARVSTGFSRDSITVSALCTASDFAMVLAGVFMKEKACQHRDRCDADHVEPAPRVQARGTSRARMAAKTTAVAPTLSAMERIAMAEVPGAAEADEAELA